MTKNKKHSKTTYDEVSALLNRYKCSVLFFFFFNDTPTTEIYTLSLHDALPISKLIRPSLSSPGPTRGTFMIIAKPDRKSTRLNSSHRTISYAVFCLKKKKK